MAGDSQIQGFKYFTEHGVVFPSAWYISSIDGTYWK